jgi:hypothetical protein
MRPTPPDRLKLSPPTLARRWGVSPDKVIGWIRTGQLRAINAAASPTGRPRWLIDEADVKLFEQQRTAQPRHAPAPRRRKATTGVIEFF